MAACSACALYFPCSSGYFQANKTKKANDHIKLRIQVHRKWHLSWPASDKSSALTHRDVGNAENAGAFLLPVVCIKLRFINAKTSPYDLHVCRKCRNERDVFLSTYMDVGSALNCWEQFWPIAWYGACCACTLYLPCSSGYFQANKTKRPPD
jgi:hypothetical protein